MRQMAWAYVISSSDRRSFKRCRRAWDMGSRLRPNYETIKPMQVFNFDRAIRDALAVYYFPGMWQWHEVKKQVCLEARASCPQFFACVRSAGETPALPAANLMNSGRTGIR